jgi:hypothetical protein
MARNHRGGGSGSAASAAARWRRIDLMARILRAINCNPHQFGPDFAFSKYTMARHLFDRPNSRTFARVERALETLVETRRILHDGKPFHGVTFYTKRVR